MAVSLYHILPTPYGGRSAFAREEIPEGTPVLFCSAPYATVIFWKFRREVCATCFAYAFESGKSKWSVKLGEDSKGAGGAWFCSEACRDVCVQENELFEGQGIGWWTEMNGVFERLMTQMAKPGKQGQKPSTKIAPAARLAYLDDITAADVTPEFVDQAWMVAEDVSLEECRNGWVEVLTEFEMDTARFVLDGIVRKVAEDVSPLFPALDHLPSGRDGYCAGAGRWSDMLELQDNELPLVASKPYILASRIRIYRFLRHLATSLSSQHRSRSGTSTPRGGSESAPLVSFTFADKLRDCLSSSMEARAIMARDHGNVFGIWDMATDDEGSEMLGWGAYIFGSYFNHDCSPNLKKVRDKRGIQFYALRDIRVGEELCISYVDETCPSVVDRAKQLGADWFFDCQCARCVKELEVIAAAA
ncbi:hypothetical protein CVT25_012491 [Psilocybe cyanescens]|uniref:SET domain-containing protein n=1 Tax=Psilocybe cyanescens TaxID=93625 RepID=A0A409X0Y7_PSICY|nr:hypothetical protein CVT25_012491 [Psilocybe cyanescens]